MPVLNKMFPEISTNGMQQAPSSLTRQPPVYHGGDLAWAMRDYPDAPLPWLDLSTGVNPSPYPFAPPPAALWQRLPDAALDRRLRQAAADCYGVSDSAAVVAAPGSQALIQLLPRLRAPGQVAVLGPTYEEHAACWAAAGHDVLCITDLAALPRRCDCLVLTNPNNPDGRILPPVQLLALAEQLQERGGWLVVDEAFADVAPTASLATHAGAPGLIVLRSFGKFFGLAGLRLGFAIAEPSLAAAVTAALGPWAVAGPTAWIAAAALADADWIAATRGRLHAAATALDALFHRRGITVLGGTDLFRLVATKQADRLFDRLCRHGIYVRRFPSQPQWLRFGLPADATAMARLGVALSAGDPKDVS